MADCPVCGLRGGTLKCQTSRCRQYAHIECVVDEQEDGCWVCTRCTPDSQDGHKYAELECSECGSGADDANMLLCDKCDRGYHMYCLKPVLSAVPKGEWLCPCCCRLPVAASKPVKALSTAEFRAAQRRLLAQTTLYDFFQVSKAKHEHLLEELCKRPAKRRRSGLVYHTKRDRQKFELPRPSIDPKRRELQLASLAAALATKEVTYSDDLVYVPPCSPGCNKAAMNETLVQGFTATNAATFKKFKEMCGAGLWAPMMVVHDPVQGFIVVADEPIKDRTLLCEYIGNVDFLSNCVQAEDDSIMELLVTDRPSTSLVISPLKLSNIARFLSGLNNSDVDMARKYNVRSARFEVDGQVRVLLYARRDIAKGERLSYDYNGLEHRYPTEHFV